MWSVPAYSSVAVFCLTVVIADVMETCSIGFNQCLSGIAAGHPNCRCMCQQSRGPTPRQGLNLDTSVFPIKCTMVHCHIECARIVKFVPAFRWICKHITYDSWSEPTAAFDFGSGSLVCRITWTPTDIVQTMKSVFAGTYWILWRHLSLSLSLSTWQLFVQHLSIWQFLSEQHVYSPSRWVICGWSQEMFQTTGCFSPWA